MRTVFCTESGTPPTAGVVPSTVESRTAAGQADPARAPQILQHHAGVKRVAPGHFQLIEQFAGSARHPNAGGPDRPDPAGPSARRRPASTSDRFASCDQLIAHGQRPARQHQSQRQVVGGVDQLTEYPQRVAVGMVQILRTERQRAGGAHLLDGGQHPVTEVRQRGVFRDETDQSGDQVERPPPARFVGGDPECAPDPAGQAAQQGVGAGRLAHPGGARRAARSPRSGRRCGPRAGQAGRRPGPTGCAAGFR